MGITNFDALKASGAIEALGGLRSRGLPVLGAGDLGLWTKGNVYHVDSGHTNASDSNPGTDPEKPLATWDAAIGKTTADNGDFIILSENHAETILTAGAIAHDKAGVTVIGLGFGNSRPKITFGAAATPASTAASVLVTAAQTRILNVIGIAGIDGLTNPFHVQAADFVFDIEWQDASAAVEAVRAILTTAAADRIAGNLVYRGFTGGNAGVNAIRLVGADGARLYVDYFGVLTTGAVEMITTQCTNVDVKGRFYVHGISNLSRNVVDTGGINSTWTVDGFDSVAGGHFSGGNAQAVALDDVGAVTAELAKVPKSDSTVSWNATALQAIQDEAEDALEGENLDHLAAVTTVAADMTAEVVDGSVFARILSKVAGGDTSSYDPTTDSLEMLSDKLGALTGDGGAGQDDSVKASLDLVHTELAKVPKSDAAVTFNATALQSIQDEAQDAIQGENLDHLAAVTTVAADMTAEVVDGSVLARILSKVAGGDTSSYDPATDSLEMLSDKVGAFTGDGGAGQDDSAKASLDLVHTEIAALPTDADVNAEVDSALNTIVPAAPTAGSLNDILSKASGGNTFDKATDSLETLSDKLGGFSGDGGAAQDDSAKASLDLAHTMLGGLDAVTTDSINGKLGTDTELADRSLFDVLASAGPVAAPAAAAPANDVSLYGALRAVYNLVVPAFATGEADIDIDQADYTSYQNLIEIAPAVGAPLSDAEITFDLAKAAGGFNATHAAETVQFAVARKVDGTNWRIDAGGDHESTAISGTSSAGRAVRLHIGSVGETEDVRVYVKLSAENAADVAFPYVLSYKALAAPTVTPVAAA